MRRALYALPFLALTVGWACDYEPATEPAFDVNVSIAADLVHYDPVLLGDAALEGSDAGIPATALQTRVEAVGWAPVGTWNLTLSADGALGLRGQDGGSAVTLSVYSNGTVHADIPVQVLQPGTGFVHAQLGTTTRDFAFQVTALAPTLSICRAGEDGQCLAEGGVIDGGAVLQVDGGVETLPLAESSGTVLHDGDRLMILVTAPGPTAPGYKWPGTVNAQGAIQLTVDGGLASMVPVEFDLGSSPISLLGVVNGTGFGKISAAVGNGPPASVSVTSGSGLMGVRQVQFIDHAGVAARNRITVCTTRTGGTLRLVASTDVGSIAPTLARVAESPNSICPPGYPGQADFVWTGNVSTALMTLVDDADASTPVLVPTLGSEVQVDCGVSEPPIWLSRDAGNGTAESLVEVRMLFVRDAFGSDGGTEPLVLAPVTIVPPTNITATPSSTTTDQHGFTTFELRVPDGIVSVPLVFQLGQRVTIARVINH